MVKAIAYTRDFMLTRNGEVVCRSSQADVIKRYAAEQGIEIVAWFSDEVTEEDLLKRPGIQKVFEYGQPWDILICERVWALSRSMAGFEPLLRELGRRGAGFESAVTTWDCVSQQCRRRLKSLPVMPRVDLDPDETGGHGRYRVAKPARMTFVHLVHRARPSV